jgi:hypothetical protein
LYGEKQGTAGGRSHKRSHKSLDFRKQFYLTVPVKETTGRPRALSMAAVYTPLFILQEE